MSDSRGLWAKIEDGIMDSTIALSFGRPGYARRRKRWPAYPDGDLDGAHVVITGTTSGLGLAATKLLVARGAKVTGVVRNVERGEAAFDTVRAAFPAADLSLERCDLSSVADVDALGARLSDGRRVDVLVNNAGVMLDARYESVDGIEMTFATNVLGGFALTEHLKDVFKRVIHVTSGGMYTQRLDMEDPFWNDKAFDGVAAYAQTKRAQVILNELWAERLPRGTVSHCMHPGWARTPGVERSLPRFERWLRPLLRTAEGGADTIAWLVGCDEALETNGLLYFDRRPRKTHLRKKTVSPPEDRQALWDLCTSTLTRLRS